MQLLLLTPASITYLAQLILGVVVSGYFIHRIRLESLHGRRLGTRLLTAYFILLTLFSLLQCISASTIGFVQLVLIYPLNVIMAGALLFLAQFAYIFPSDSVFRRRTRILALGVSIAYLALEAALLAWRLWMLAGGQPTLRPTWANLILAGLVLWITLVMFTQARRTGERISRSARSMAVALLASFALSLVVLLGGKLIISPAAYHMVLSLGISTLLLSFAVIYLQRLPETTSFVVKLVGLMLLSWLVMISLVSWALSAPHAADFIPSLYRSGKANKTYALVFTPSASGGYAIERQDAGTLPYPVEPGEPLEPGAPVDLGFDFPFFGHIYRQVHVAKNGYISLGEPPNDLRLAVSYGGLPAIFALVTELANPEISLQRAPDHVVITWQQAASSRHPGVAYSMQAILNQSGDFQIYHSKLQEGLVFHPNQIPETAPWLVGAIPGNSQPLVVDGDGLPSFSGEQGVVQDIDLAFRLHLDKLLRPLFFLTLATSLLYILAWPRLLHANLLAPLNELLAGVERMNAGEHGVRVTPRSNDEIGFLARSFSRMSAELDSLLADLQQRVTERTDELAAAEEEYRILFELESDAIVLIENRTCRILAANKAACTLYGFSREELLEMRNVDLSAEPDSTREATQVTHPVNKVVTIPLRYHRKRDGTIFPVEITARFFVWRGRDVHLAAIRDITERVRIMQDLERLAITDGLTGLYNRRHFFELGQAVFARTDHPRAALAALMVDIDHFKLVNDRLGHAGGDVVLRTLAERLRDNLRPTDIIGRWGGEEFAILLPRTSCEEAGRIAERLRASVSAAPIENQGSTIVVTLSIGVAVVDVNVLTLDALLQRADAALYVAKRAGRNLVATWDD